MARTGKIKLFDTEYTLCYSSRVGEQIEEKYGDLQAGLEKMETDRDFVEFLALLMEAGYRWDKYEGKEPPKPMGAEELMDRTTKADMVPIHTAINETLINSLGRKVEARNIPKKGKGATQAE